MKKLTKEIFFIMCLIFIPMQAYAEDTTPEPYNTEEFPQSLKDLRRFEIISLGALPFVTMDVTLIYSGLNWYKSGFDPNSAPNLFAINTYTPEEQKKIMLTSIGISLGVGFTDFTVRLVKRIINKNKSKALNKSVLVTPIESDPDAIKLSNPYDENESTKIIEENQTEDIVTEAVEEVIDITEEVTDAVEEVVE